MEPLLNSLSLLRLLVGKTVVLVVDQAEEILTHPGSNGCTEAFFRLIEEIYLRDFDVRLIISLRTEYYGRFRNHLQIRDRYRALPADGGLELYLLNLLRDPEVLTHALDWPASNGQHEYGFRFAPGALRKIVEDVLGHLPPNASRHPGLAGGVRDPDRAAASGPSRRGDRRTVPAPSADMDRSWIGSSIRRSPGPRPAGGIRCGRCSRPSASTIR